MYKNRLQELAQRSCFNLPSYACIREGPDHAPRFKATVNFNGEAFESPNFYNTLRQAEHAAAEVALNVLSDKSPSKGLVARVMDETGVYKTLLQETAHRAGLKLPVYTTVRSGPGHVPTYSCMVELAGMSFTGEPAKSKKQGQKNAAVAAWSALKRMSHSGSSTSSPLLECGGNDEQEQVIVARYLSSIQPPKTKKLMQGDQRLGKASASFWEDIVPHGDRSLCSTQYQSWAYPQFSPEFSTNQCWPLETTSQQQRPLVELSSIQTPPPRRQILPLFQSIVHPGRGQYFLAREPVSYVQGIGPYLYVSNHAVPIPLPIRFNSQVTIQEIDESPAVEGSWPCADPNSDCWENVASVFPVEIPYLPVPLTRHPEKRSQEVAEAMVGSTSDGNSPQLNNEINQSNWTSPRHRSRATITNDINFDFQKPNNSSNNTRPESPRLATCSGFSRAPIPAPFSSPVTVRNAGAVSPGSLRQEGTNSLISAPPRVAVSACKPTPWFVGIKNSVSMPSSNLMAPPVQIRSVVPVCSAPARKIPGSSEEARFAEGGKKYEQEGKTLDTSSKCYEL